MDRRPEQEEYAAKAKVWPFRAESIAGKAWEQVQIRSAAGTYKSAAMRTKSKI
jgi:hypothetical protein